MLWKIHIAQNCPIIYVVSRTYFPIISQNNVVPAFGNILLSTVYVPMSFYCIFPIASTWSLRVIATTIPGCSGFGGWWLNLVDHGKPRQLRDNDRFQCWSWSFYVRRSLSSIGTRSLVAFFSHTEPFSNSAAAAATPTRHIWITPFFQVILSILYTDTQANISALILQLKRKRGGNWK